MRPHAHRVFTRADQISHRFVRVVGHIDRAELAGAMKPREREAVAAIGLHPIPAPLRGHRRTDDDALLAVLGQMSVDAEAARPGFVHEVQRSIRGSQRSYHFVERLEIARDHAVVADFALALAVRDRHVNRFLVDIQPHEHATVLHDRPPRVWRCAPSCRRSA